VYDLARQQNLSGRNVERWLFRWATTITPKNQDGDLRMLCERKRGPARRDLGGFDDWMGRYLVDWFESGLTIRQCHERLLGEIQARQAAWKLGDIYPVPSYSKVRRFLARRHALQHARRRGPDALKAACGYLDRRYDDLLSLERVETDEWIADCLAYDPAHAGRVGRYYLLTFLDARSIYPLTWSLVEHPNESDEIDLLMRLIVEYGVPGLLSSDRALSRADLRREVSVAGPRRDVRAARRHPGPPGDQPQPAPGAQPARLAPGALAQRAGHVLPHPARLGGREHRGAQDGPRRPAAGGAPALGARQSAAHTLIEQG